MSDLIRFHQNHGAQFSDSKSDPEIAHYGNFSKEHDALRESAGILDLSFRSRLCLLGADRVDFIHGQVTNDVKNLKVGEGCYAALVNSTGRMESDFNLYRLQDEILLDFEPGLISKVQDRLERFVVASDVQFVDVAPHYGLLSVQGPRAKNVVENLDLKIEIPSKKRSYRLVDDSLLGRLYVMNNPRLGTCGFDFFVPAVSALQLAEQLSNACEKTGGRLCGCEAFELARIEAGIPRFGIDMDENNLPPETGLESELISYSKGCYIGQEVIARIRTYGQVAKKLHGLRIDGIAGELPTKGTKIELDGKDAGYVTSAARSRALGAIIALGYIRRGIALDANFELQTLSGKCTAKIVPTPFV